MKLLLVIFTTTIICAHAYKSPFTFYGSSESSEEEYHVLVSSAQGQHPLNLPGVGIYNQHILHAVKVKVPRYLSPEVKRQIIIQYLAARGLTLKDFAGQPAEKGVIGDVATTTPSVASTPDVSVNELLPPVKTSDM